MFRSKGWFFHTSPVVCKLCSLEPCRDCVGLQVLGSTQEAVLNSQTISGRLSGSCQSFRSAFFGSFPPGKHFPVGRTFKTSQGRSVYQSSSKLVVCVCMPSRFSLVRLFVTLWTVAHQASLSMGLSRQEYCSGYPGPPPGDVPNPGIEHASLKSALVGRFFSTSSTWEAQSW